MEGTMTDEKEVFNKSDDIASFADRTTFHGLRYVVNDSSKLIRRIFWLTVLLIMVIFYIYTAAVSVQRYSGYESTTNIEHTPKESLEFPAVTICSQRLMRNSNLDSLYPGLSNLLQEVVFGKREYLSLPTEAQKVLENVTIYDENIDALDPQKETLLSCQINGKHFNCTDGFHATHSKMSACYTFQTSEQYALNGPILSHKPGYILALSKLQLSKLWYVLFV